MDNKGHTPPRVVGGGQEAVAQMTKIVDSTEFKAVLVHRPTFAQARRIVSQPQFG